jgi:ABC-2 type transport system permease protein
MEFVLATAKKDLRRQLRDPFGLLVWMGVPLLIVGILSVIFGQSGGTPRGLLLVADEDESIVSSLVTGSFNQAPLSEMLTVERVEQAAGRGRMERGDASALLVIPKGFGSAVLRNQPTKLTLVVNPAQRIVPRVVEESLSLLAEATFYLQEMAAEPLRAIRDAAQGPWFSDETISRISVLFSTTFRQLRVLFSRPVIELETSVVSTDRPAFNFAAAFFPAMLFMALLFSAQGLSEDVWVERRLGTLRRVAVAPRSLLSVLVGKALAATIIIGAIVTVAFLSAFLFGIEIRNPVIAAVWVTLSGGALYLMMLTLQLFATAQRTGNVLTSMVVFPFALLGGSFFPFEAMPAGLAAIGRWTPNGWSVTVLKTILDGTAALTDLRLPVLAVAAWIILFFALASWRLRAVAGRP